MTKRLVSLSLPAFAFVEGVGNNDILENRNVIVHCPTGTIMEIVERSALMYVEPNILTVKFKYLNDYNVIEHYAVLLHVSPTFNKKSDNGTLCELMGMAAEWFCKYMEWEDSNK